MTIQPLLHICKVASCWPLLCRYLCNLVYSFLYSFNSWTRVQLVWYCQRLLFSNIWLLYCCVSRWSLVFNVSSLLMYSSSGCFTGHGSPILDLILAITLTDISSGRMSAANMLASTSIVSRAAGLGCPTHTHWHALLLKSSFWILSIEGSAKVDRHSLSQILTGCIWSNLILEILCEWLFFL